MKPNWSGTGPRTSRAEPHALNVDTNNGTVYPTGSVDTADRQAPAEQLAWQAEGVKTVVNTFPSHEVVHAGTLVAGGGGGARCPRAVMM